MSGLSLFTGVVAVCDMPPELFEYGLADHAEMVRTFEPYIATGRTDREAWDALFDDEKRLRFTQTVYGNRPTKARKGRWARQDAEHQRRQASLFGGGGGST